jgi:hypothetical protein
VSWEWVALLLGAAWAAVAVVWIAAWSDAQRRKPRSIAEMFGGRRDRTLTTVSVQPYEEPCGDGDDGA